MPKIYFQFLIYLITSETSNPVLIPIKNKIPDPTNKYLKTYMNIWKYIYVYISYKGTLKSVGMFS